MDLTKLSAYDYDLPENLIAQVPHDPADECKLLYCKVKDDFHMKDLIFKDIVNLLSANDVLFFNNSKVIKARLTPSKDLKFFVWENECKNCEILFLKKLENNLFEALVRPGKKFKLWKKITLSADKDYCFEVVDYTSSWRIIKYLWDENIFEILEKLWQMPLPPYIQYSKEKEKPYQPVVAKNYWSVAAPTASLHFTPRLLNSLKEKWIEFLESTLHIGIWTFKLVDTEDITNYNIHSETAQVPLNVIEKILNLKKQWKKIVAVWTTSVRILESIPYVLPKIEKLINFDKKFLEKWDYITDLSVNNDVISFNTKLYIYPGFKYKIVDKLITNFHLPKSSLLMLVSAFMGYENMMKAYKHAIKNNYKFFSFWDAMFIEKV